MPAHRHLRLLLPFLLLRPLAACDGRSDGVAGPREPARENVPVAPPAAPVPATTPALRIDWLPGTLMAGVSVFPSARSSVPGPGPVQWASSDTTRLTVTGIGSSSASVSALRPGDVEVIAMQGSGVARRQVTVVAAPAAPTPIEQTDLVVTRFALLDLGGTSGWDFTPAIEVRARGDHPVTILGFRLSVPGVTGLPACWTTRVAGGTSSSLVRESYGDWDLTFTSPDRSTGGPVLVRILAQEATGRVVAVEVEGAIEPGAPPPTYTGGAVEAPWSCG